MFPRKAPRLVTLDVSHCSLGDGGTKLLVDELKYWKVPYFLIRSGGGAGSIRFDLAFLARS